MKRLLPNSLLGQVMLVLALGLLVGQAISAVLLYRAAEDRRETALVSALAFRLVTEVTRPEIAERRARREARRAERRELGLPVRELPPGPFGGRMRFGIETVETSPIQDDEERLARYENALREVLVQQDIVAGEIVITKRRAADDPFVRRFVENRAQPDRPGWQERTILVAAVQQSGSSDWMVARVAAPRAPRNALGTIVLQTVLIFAILFALLYFVLRRITRPLASLTTRMTDFSRKPDQVVLLEESGPADMRRLIAAHNAMETRIAALLDEKDVMLGAIGHDLKTPLAALRVRIESVPDDLQRERMAASIEDITETLDDILALARVGRLSQAVEPVDLSALAASVVDEFEDLDQPVTLVESERLVAPVQVTWVRRALRNLVSNAVRYGGSARVSLAVDTDAIILRVDDDGPGIPDEAIADMLEPFTRGEGSRNRATGGAGLGLTLARAIAEQHGGSLSLTNRRDADGIVGLQAEMRLPKG